MAGVKAVRDRLVDSLENVAVFEGIERPLLEKLYDCMTEAPYLAGACIFEQVV